MVVRSKKKGRFVIGSTSRAAPDASMHKEKSQDTKLISMNVTEYVCYNRMHVENDVSYDQVLVPDDHVSYERVLVPDDHDIIPGEVDSGKRTHPPPTNHINVQELVGTNLTEVEHFPQ